MQTRTIIGVVIAMLALTGCGKTYKELAEQPPIRPNEVAPTSAESLITLNALFHYETISKALTEALPTNVPLQGRQSVCINVNKEVQQTVEKQVGGDVGKVLGAVARFITTVVTVNQVENLCLDIDYNANIVRDGPAVISALPSGVRLSLPIRAEGSAGFVGALADFFALNKKNFRGSLTAWADVEMGIDEAWCPTFLATPNFVWRNKAELEVAGKFWIDIDGEAGPAIKKAMNDAVAKIPALLTCDKVKQLVAPIWHVYDISLARVAGQAGRIIVTPQRVGFSGFSYTPTGAQLALMLVAKTEVILGDSPASATTDLLPLPKLERMSPKQNELNLTVPITVTYDSLERLATAAVVGKTYEGKAGSTAASATIKEVKIYPSGDDLVVGVKFDSKISAPTSLTPKGWVYFLAKPSFDPALQSLSLVDFSFSRIIDNDLWNVLSPLFQNQIWSTVQNATSINLRPIVTEARTAMKKELATVAAREGINVTLDDQFLGLTKIALTKIGPQIDVAFRGSADIVVLSMPTKGP
ncbi:DUF4403 family protein [Variovorax sp. J22R24]|uniref:DUF4403 family protein n=1 Tax=Variovorax gracilis TaxID=3053502 RepID=UPI002576F874|nr:DUF4403 family protein [Variovorax sp. J22R24]MDM0109841.1 DUF4403 family protein [Variovorax sp. J22R24]